MTNVYLYKGFERFWPWTQAVLILLLGLTGFEIHGTFEIFGYRQAVAYHNAAAIALLVLIAFAIFWHFTTGEWRQYIPTRRFLRAQFEYYVTGIFRDSPHPTRKSEASKLNPLQKLVYLGLKALVIPVMAISGLLYMFVPHTARSVALAHTAGAFFLAAFVVSHMYLITTGETPLSNLKAMLTGHEELKTEPELDGARLPEPARGQA